MSKKARFRLKLKLVTLVFGIMTVTIGAVVLTFPHFNSTSTYSIEHVNDVLSVETEYEITTNDWVAENSTIKGL